MIRSLCAVLVGLALFVATPAFAAGKQADPTAVGFNNMEHSYTLLPSAVRTNSGVTSYDFENSAPRWAPGFRGMWIVVDVTSCGADCDVDLQVAFEQEPDVWEVMFDITNVVTEIDNITVWYPANTATTGVLGLTTLVEFPIPSRLKIQVADTGTDVTTFGVYVYFLK